MRSVVCIVLAAVVYIFSAAQATAGLAINALYWVYNTSSTYTYSSFGPSEPIISRPTSANGICIHDVTIYSYQ